MFRVALVGFGALWWFAGAIVLVPVGIGGPRTDMAPDAAVGVVYFGPAIATVLALLATLLPRGSGIVGTLAASIAVAWFVCVLVVPSYI